MIRSHIAVAVAAVTAASAFAGEAHAQAVTATVVAPAPAVVESGGVEANRAGFSVAGVAGLAFAASGYGAAFEFGARAGYTLPMHLYVGGDLGYQINSFGFFHVQAEVGYEIGISSVPQLLIRPYGGIGLVYFTGGGGGNCVTIGGITECGGGGGGGGAAGFLFSPGVVVAYQITRGFFVGGDARIPIYAGSGITTAGFDLLATGGYKF
jgi:hypothetical protein